MAIMHSITLHACLSEPTTKIWMQIDPYCQWRKCSPVNVVSSDIRVMQIFAGVREIWGVKQESGHLRCRFSYLSHVKTINMQICKYANNLTDVLLYIKCLFTLAIFSESSSPRHDKLTQCCCTFTLALARLSCLQIHTRVRIFGTYDDFYVPVI